MTQLSYRATIIPDALFGRVTSSIRLFTVGALSLGSAIVGALLQTTGPMFTVFACTALLLLIALATSVNRSIHATDIA